MVKYLDAVEKQLSRELWEEAFPQDSRSFDDYYYQEKMKDNRVLAICEEKGAAAEGEMSAVAPERKVVIQAMIQLNPYLLEVRHFKWRADYLVGVATRIEKRHQGCMRRLLLRMMEDMRVEQMPFCFLMPADEVIYKPCGFTWLVRQPQWRLRENIPLARRAVLPAEKNVQEGFPARGYAEFLAGFMNQWLARRYQVYAVRDEEYLVRLLKELASENGTLDMLYDGDTMIGLASEWGLEKREQRLLYCEEPYVEVTAEPKPAIMARIISPEVFVQAIRLRTSVAEKEKTLLLDIKDDQIGRNNAAWLWRLNHETSRLERLQSGMFDALQRADANGEPILHLSIDELTSWLFGYGVPEAAREYDMLVETLHGVFLDEIV